MPVVPSLLVPLLDRRPALRQKALDCFAVLQAGVMRLPANDRPAFYSATPLLHLVDAICNSRLEISKDPSVVQQVFGRLFSTEVDFSGGQVRKLDQTPQRRRKSDRRAELKKRAEIREAVLQCVLVHVVAMGAPPHVQCALVEVLEEVEHEVRGCLSLPVFSLLLP